MHQLLKIFLPHPALAQSDWGGNCVMTNYSDVATIQGFNCLFANIGQIIIPIVGLVFLIMFISGGFFYLTAGGDPKKTARATHTLSMSIFGIIGVILAFLILLFIQKFTGITVTEFNIPSQ